MSSVDQPAALQMSCIEKKEHTNALHKIDLNFTQCYMSIRQNKFTDLQKPWSKTLGMILILFHGKTLLNRQLSFMSNAVLHRASSFNVTIYYLAGVT